MEASAEQGGGSGRVPPPATPEKGVDSSEHTAVRATNRLSLLSSKTLTGFMVQQYAAFLRRPPPQEPQGRMYVMCTAGCCKSRDFCRALVSFLRSFVAGLHSLSPLTVVASFCPLVDCRVAEMLLQSRCTSSPSRTLRSSGRASSR